MPENNFGFDPDRLDMLDAYIKTKYLDSGRMPFADLLIGRGDEVAHRWTSGVAEDAIFRIASMSKPITSVAAMQLVEQCRLVLSDPVEKYVPELVDQGVFVAGGGEQPFVRRPPERPMQILDLMRHTSGLTYGFQERTPVDAAYRASDLEKWTKVDGDDDFIARLAKIPLDFDPGSSWNYSVATDLLGVIIARISGMSLGGYLKTHIFDPLGMVDTCFDVPKEKADRIPACYAYDPDKLMVPHDGVGTESAWAGSMTFHGGGGGLVSTTADFHRFTKMLLNGGTLDGARIISRHTLAMMTRNHLPGGGDLTQHSKSLFSEAQNEGVGFGLGFATVLEPGSSFRSKGEFYWGGMYSTAFTVDPANDLVMVFMTQLMPSMLYPIRSEITTMMAAAMVD